MPSSGNSSRSSFALSIPRHSALSEIWSVVLLAMIAICTITPGAVRAQGGLPRLTQDQQIEQRRTSPQETPRAERRITITVEKGTVESVVKEIARRAGLRIVLVDGLTLPTRSASIRVHDVTPMQALTVALAGTNIDVMIASDGETVIFRQRAADSTKRATDRDVGAVVGRVVDAVSGHGIVGVSVGLLGGAALALTDVNGRFMISHVQSGATELTFKLLGYRGTTKVVHVIAGDTAMLRVALSPAANVLSDVVTTVTGTQRRVEISNDITTLNVDSIMRVAPIRSVSDLLAARVPGMQVLATTGAPGDPSRIRLRGAASINGSNSPIVIVNGIRVYAPDSSSNAAGRLGAQVNSGGPTLQSPDKLAYPAPSPLDQIDPNSIEKIEVIKGPSASALYGSDAANGVIVITTKRGRAGATRLNMSFDVGTSDLLRRYPETVFVFGHGLNRESWICRWGEICEVDSIVRFQALNDPRYSPIGRGTSLKTSLFLSGGTSSLTYAVMGSISRQNGLTRLPGLAAEFYERTAAKSVPGWMRRPDQYDHYSGTSTLEVTPTPAVAMRLNSSLSYSDQQRSSLGAEAGTRLLNRWIDEKGYSDNSRSVFFLAGFQERVTATTLTMRHDMTVRWHITPTVPLTLRTGVNTVQTTDKTILEPGLDGALGPISSDQNGRYAVARNHILTPTVSGNSVFSIGSRENVQLNFGIGADFSSTSKLLHRISTTNLVPGISDPATFDPRASNVSQSKSMSGSGGLYFSPELSVRSRVFINTGFRFDAGTASGDRAGLMGMPKIGASWLILDPSDPSIGFARHTLLLSHVKLRGAFGHAGIQPRPAQHLRLYHEGQVSVDGGVTYGVGYNVTSLGNTRLVPERVTEWEAGIDAGLIDDRMTWSMTVYRKRTRDAILRMALPLSVGFNQSFDANIGTVLNTGYEVSMSARPVDTRSVMWQSQLSLSHRTNRLLSLSEGALRLQGGLQRLRVGYPISGFWERPLGSYGDLNGDGMLQRDEYTLADSTVYLGTSDPRYSLLMNTTMSLMGGRLTLDAAFEYQDGFTQHNVNGAYAIAHVARIPGASLRTQAIASVTGIDPVVPGSINREGLTNFYLIQTINLLRMRSASVSVRLPSSLAARFGMRSADLSLQGSNLGLWTNYRGNDPSVNSFSSGNYSADYGQLPPPRQFNLRVNLQR